MRLRQKRINAEIKATNNIGRYGNALDLVRGRRKAILTHLTNPEEEYTDVRTTSLSIWVANVNRLLRISSWRLKDQLRL